MSEKILPADVMARLGVPPDPWQIEVLGSTHPRLLLNCCRQAGKSTVVAFLGLFIALSKPMARVLLLSRSQRQAAELFRSVLFFHRLLGERGLKRRTIQELELHNLSRILCLPCKEETVRGYAKVDVLVIDEAARVPDELYRAVRPMLAVSQGRLICLSTPYGKRGFFWDAWAKGGDDWLRVEVPASQIPRIPKEFLDAERRALGDAWFRQEYCCSFEALQGLVYPDFARCVVSVEACPWPADFFPSVEQAQRGGRQHRFLPPDCDTLRKLGGIDFGFRNPFAALWGFLDRDDVLHLTHERYLRQTPLHEHARALPRDVMWYADPAGATEIAELRCAGLKVRRGANDIRAGIAAVTGRIRTGRLKVHAAACPHLVAEARLYRYGGDEQEAPGETPIDADNHALAALRYLISTLDARRVARGAGERET
jgi:hypothetical protein